jgi:hypothetical protein
MATGPRPGKPATTPAANFKDALHALVKRSRFRSYRGLARKINYSHVTLARAAAGRTGWNVVESIVVACGDDPAAWRPQWTAAIAADTVADGNGPLPERPVILDPAHASSPAEFVACLRALKATAGDWPYRLLARHTGLASSTIADALRLNRRSVPKWETVEPILMVLGVSEADRANWRRARSVLADPPAVARNSGGDHAHPLLRQAIQLGLEGIYPTRLVALDAFVEPLEREIRNGTGGRIWIFASSGKGLVQMPVGRFNGISIISRAQAAGCDLRILFTHPELADRRASQERRPYGAILKEVRLSLGDLLLAEVDRRNVKYCSGAPTVFGICTSDLMLLNSYPFGVEAYGSYTIIVRRTPNVNSGIFHTYEREHFEKAWDAGAWITEDEWSELIHGENARETPKPLHRARRKSA